MRAFAYGTWVDCVIANSGTLSAAVDLGRNYDFLNIFLPTLTSGKFSLQVAETADGTYYDLGASITTETTTGGYMDTWHLGGNQFIKIKSSVSQDAERTFRIRGLSRAG